MDKLKYYFIALRPQQWIKNLFVLLPLIFSHRLMEITAAITSLEAFWCFCGVASGVYIFNDVIDLKQDRLHPTKKLRPLASGKIPVGHAGLMGSIATASGLTFGFFLNPLFALLLFCYFIGNLAYSLFLKNMVIVDVMCIALFFLIRVISGAVVIHVEISYWLLICTGTLALFLGFNKRRQEIHVLGIHAQHHRPILQRYSKYFIDQMVAVLTASTVIFYTLYTVDRRTIDYFGTSSLLYTIPFVYYGIFRYLYLVHKRRQGGDPVRVVLKDNKMQINIVLWILAVILIVYFKF